ncbi:G patch domain-containing protein 11 [Pseudolycoriella hygida]|uniref:G patch domain-containing protein 11 n=1 Tax=Pseudolycoriella hygida TaxID=35572 RepID=A0A9Q0S8K9_9DIPT|nr:G patch domain-containing protein 11 [Pseudolycoriella hygida]
MSSEEEDYMSDIFLPKEDNEIRPGLIKSKANQRSIAVSTKKAKYDEDYRAKMKPTKFLEEERRQEGLSSAISSQNKGFAMLAKMGYKEGDSIGKTSKGILEPIGIDIKTDRGGLGRDAALKQLKEHRQMIRLNRLNKIESNDTISTAEFRKRMTEKAQGKQMEADLGKCQRACEKLDLEEHIEKPALEWFWPNRKTVDENEEKSEESGDDSDEEVEYELAEKLEMITNYLRTTYCFCHWCGTKYSDTSDLSSSCPGMNKDDH